MELKRLIFIFIFGISSILKAMEEPEDTEIVIQTNFRNLNGRVRLFGALSGVASGYRGGPITFTAAPIATLTISGGLSPAYPIITATGFSSGISSVNSDGGENYRIAINLSLPITFVTAYSSVPILQATIETSFPMVSSMLSSIVDSNASTSVQVMYRTLQRLEQQLASYLPPEVHGRDYDTALSNLQTNINGIIASGLSVNISASGIVA